MQRSIRTGLAACITLLMAAGPALCAGFVYLVRVGTDAEGNPAFRAADSRDTYLAGLFELEQNSRALQEASRYNQEVQRDGLAATLQGRGITGQDLATAMAAYPPEPVFVEVTNGTSGSYNDWKGRFSVTYASGQTATYSSPRVVFPLGGDVARSGDRGLMEQTLVHEVAHGTMSAGLGRDALPDTPWLSKPHSGGTVSDEPLAYIEGWSEFIGAYFTGRRTIAEDPSGSMDSNWYARRADGSYKPAAELVRTEGWMATVLYKIATEGRNQNAMWKMTQVMSRARPQSAVQLLAATAQYFPELAPTIDSVVNQASGGQITSLTGRAVASSPAGGGAYASGTRPGGGVDRLEQALYGDRSTAYQAYAEYAAAQQAGSGQASGAAIAQDTRQLEQLYLAKRQQLDSVPWWKFWEKSKIKEELAMIEDVYARQLDLSAPAPAQPDSPVIAPAQAPTAPVAGTAAPDSTYRSVVDALQSGQGDSARQALEARRAAAEARRGLRQAGPQSER